MRALKRRLSNSFGFGGVNAALIFQEVGMSRIFIAGIGAVSPAGWNVAALRDGFGQGRAVADSIAGSARLGKAATRAAGAESATRPEFLAHPRLRRTSPITHYAASAALEAIAGLRAHPAGKIFGWASLRVCNRAACSTRAAFMMKR